MRVFFLAQVKILEKAESSEITSVLKKTFSQWDFFIGPPRTWDPRKWEAGPILFPCSNP